MAQMFLTFIDVGWGDSILIEVIDSQGYHHFALVDSNDTSNSASTQIFLKRHFERYSKRFGLVSLPYPLFDIVFATHAHADHIAGLQGVLRQWGTQELRSSRFNNAKNAAFANTLRWSKWATRNGSPVVGSHGYLANKDTLSLGPVAISVLWPEPPAMGAPNQPNDLHNENNNSLVLSFRLRGVSFVLSGDCEADNWAMKGTNWPVNLPGRGLKVVQIPHHGAHNGLFDSLGGTPLLDQIGAKHHADPTVDPLLVLSCHPHPHDHPDPAVSRILDARNLGGKFASWAAPLRALRTDENLHFTVWTDGKKVETLARPFRS